MCTAWVKIKKRKPRYNPKSLKSKRKNHKIVISGWKHIYLSLIWYIGHSYWVRDDCSAIIFVKHVKTVFVQVLSCTCSTQRSADAWINCRFVVKAPANAIMQHKQRKLGQTQFDMFFKTDCCAAIHSRIWMNIVPNEGRLNAMSGAIWHQVGVIWHPTQCHITPIGCHKTPCWVSYDTMLGVIMTPSGSQMTPSRASFFMTPRQVSYDTELGVIWHSKWSLYTLHVSYWHLWRVINIEHSRVSWMPASSVLSNERMTPLGCWVSENYRAEKFKRHPLGVLWHPNSYFDTFPFSKLLVTP